MSKQSKTHTEPFVGISKSLLQSPAFIALDPSAVKLYIDLRLKYTGFNNGNIDATLTNLKHRGWSSQHTLARAIRQLEAVGFIKKTRQSIGVQKGSKVCNLFRFTDVECPVNAKLEIPFIKATKDYLAFASKGHALKVVKEASPSKSRSIEPKQEKTSVQFQHRNDAISAPHAKDGDATTASMPNTPSAVSASSRFHQILSKRLLGEARRRFLIKHRPSSVVVQKLHPFIALAKPAAAREDVVQGLDVASVLEAIEK